MNWEEKARVCNWLQVQLMLWLEMEEGFLISGCCCGWASDCDLYLQPYYAAPKDCLWGPCCTLCRLETCVTYSPFICSERLKEWLMWGLVTFSSLCNWLQWRKPENEVSDLMFATSVDEYVYLFKKLYWALEGALTHFLKEQRIWIT